MRDQLDIFLRKYIFLNLILQQKIDLRKIRDCS